MVCICGYKFCWNCLKSYSNHSQCQMVDEFLMFQEKWSNDVIKMYNFKFWILSSEFYKKLKPEIMTTLNIRNDNCQILVNQILDFSFEIVNKHKLILWIRIMNNTSKKNHRDIFEKILFSIPKIRKIIVRARVFLIYKQQLSLN
ncbi:hypothetical protein BpHYR1_027468 [Brachionus plicatilis]|uniref:Uncharacterized protein n=1 Tax=Brachionus plicatilis TaxID=10195 RepID=A0A3M7QEU0_BRAPC|nr:hypothetical protein BpHYR1_027468 [Brachionus plicatilis]